MTVSRTPREIALIAALIPFARAEQYLSEDDGREPADNVSLWESGAAADLDAGDLRRAKQMLDIHAPGWNDPTPPESAP